jgi:hypothetical protein
LPMVSLVCASALPAEANASAIAAIVAAQASAIRGIGMSILPVFFDEPRQPRRSENATMVKAQAVRDR